MIKYYWLSIVSTLHSNTTDPWVVKNVHFTTKWIVIKCVCFFISKAVAKHSIFQINLANPVLSVNQATRKAAKFKTEIYRLGGQSNSPRNHHLTIFFLFPCYLYSTWKPNTTDNPSIRSDKGKAPETSKQIVSHCLTAFSSISEFRFTVLASIFSYSTLYGTVPYRIDLNLYCTQPTVVRVLNKSPNLGNAQGPVVRKPINLIPD